MHVAEIRARVQVELVQDFDGAREDFVQETGDARLRSFVEHLGGFGLISPALVKGLVDELVAAGDPAEPISTPTVDAPAPQVPVPPAELASHSVEPPLVDSTDEVPRQGLFASQDEIDSNAPTPTPAGRRGELAQPSSAGRPSGDPLATQPRAVIPRMPDPLARGNQPANPANSAPTPLSTAALPASTPKREISEDDQTVLRRETPPPREIVEDRTVRLSEVTTVETDPSASRDTTRSREHTDSDATPVGAGGRAPTAPRGSQPANGLDAGGSGARSLDSPTARTPTRGPRRTGATDLKGTKGESSDEWEDVEVPEDEHPRTMFRKVTGGQLRETGRFAADESDTAPTRKRRRKKFKPQQYDPRYEFVGSVGEGAMGRIHLARDRDLHRQVAYKAMSEELADQKTLSSKFTAEAQITAQLDHPNIVPIYSLESDSAYTMKLIEGRTLESVIGEVKNLRKSRKPVPDDWNREGLLDMFLRICEAVAYANSRGVIHRDLKPENIMIGAWGEVYVMDWGIAKVFSRDVPHPVATGAQEEDEGELVIGTPGYMSPEQAEGFNDQLDAASDQYALGLILFEMLTLKPAVTGKAPLKIVMRHQDGEKDSFTSAFGDRIPPELLAITNKATAKDKRNRYKNVEELTDDIRRFLRGEPVRARPDSLFQSVLRWVGRHRELTLFSIIAVFAASALLVFTIVGYTQFQLSAAQAREQKLSNLITTASRQTSLVEGQFLKFEGLLSVIAATAGDALGRGDVTETTFFEASQFETAGPPDAEASAKYGGQRTSPSQPAFVIPAAADPSQVWKLGRIDRQLQRVLLRSHSEQRATTNRGLVRRTLLEVEIPVAYAWVALESGVFESFPGHGGWPADYDARKTPTYEAARAATAPVWGAASLHPTGTKTILPCSVAITNEVDELLGVAGIDVSLDWLLEDLLLPDELKDVQGVETFLVDPAGNVVVRSSLRGTKLKSGIAGRQLPTRPFAVEAVLTAVKEHRSDWTEAEVEGEDAIVLYNRMNSNGWYYVVQGDPDELLR